MWTPESLAVIAATFVIAGFVKGVVGLGLPSVSLALLTATLGLKVAMTLMVVPALATNFWQGVTGGNFKRVVARFWTLVVASAIGIWLAVGVLATSDGVLLTVLLGVLLTLYAGVSLVTPQIPPPGRWEPGLAPAIGLISGFLSGITGSYIIPSVLYLQALGMPRDQLIQAMGFIFTAATLAIGLSLAGYEIMTFNLALLSAAALIPTALGMAIGIRVRRRIPDAKFRRVFFIALLSLGGYIVVRSIVEVGGSALT